MPVVIVIPARLGSWRFPNKPLTPIHSMPMLEHVYRRSLLASGVDEVVIAVCDEALADAARSWGAKVIMTAPDCPSACDRVAQAAESMGLIHADDVVMNIQGDEPAVPPPVIEMTAEVLRRSGLGCANLVEPILNDSELSNPHRIKAVLSRSERLLYLTRQGIPAAVFDVKRRSRPLRQTCVFAFRGDALQSFSRLERSSLELIEGIDLLRLIENDVPVASGVTSFSTYPVDTPDDVPIAEKALESDKWLSSYHDKIERT